MNVASFADLKFDENYLGYHMVEVTSNVFAIGLINLLTSDIL